MSQPLVSVIIDNFNYAEFLGEAIESALAQTYSNTELIVVDDGSTDGSRAVLERFGGRVRALYQANAGPAAAFNAGVAASSGEIIAFLDSDDAWRPRKLERVVSGLAAYPSAGWLRHRLAMVDSAGRALDGAVLPAIHRTQLRTPAPLLVLEGRLSAGTSGLVLRRDVARRVFPMPAGVPGDDHPVSLRFDADAIVVAKAAATGAPLLSLDEVLGVYRRHDRQQYVGAIDLGRMLQRQIDLAGAVAEVFREQLGRRITPSTVYKLSAIQAALAGERPWSRRRLGALWGGLRRAGALVPVSPRTALRQSLALGFAFVLPRVWAYKLLRTGGYPDAALPPRGRAQSRTPVSAR